MPSLGWTTNEAVAPAAMAMPVAGWAGPIPTALTVAAPAAMVTNMRVANGLEVAVPDALDTVDIEAPAVLDTPLLDPRTTHPAPAAWERSRHQ
jgi:hypothetical protein